MLRRQTTFQQPEDRSDQRWHLVDAAGVPLGRLAADVAVILMGKHRPDYTPHVLSGDFVIVTNASQIGLTGRKASQRVSQRYSGYPGGLKVETFGHLRDRRPQRLVEQAVRRMLPKNRLGRHMLRRLRVFPGPDHPHQAQQPVPLSVG